MHQNEIPAARKRERRLSVPESGLEIIRIIVHNILNIAIDDQAGKPMRFFLNFLRQDVPRAGKELPLYYRRGLIASEGLLVVYFLVCFGLYPLIYGCWEWVPPLFAAGACGGLWAARHRGAKPNLHIFAALCMTWVFWNVYKFGWSSGVQHFLTLLLVFVFFNIYGKPVSKIIWFFVILLFRVALFSWSQQHLAALAEVIAGRMNSNTIYQTLNTVVFFLMLSVTCVIFSTSIQDTERQLRLRNQTLYKEAGTDPLTGLPNRRSMIERIENYLKTNPGEPFSVAIADIDYFKNVNDTYGHNCGDYTLVKLTELFTQHSGGRYSVCRWGGEEFCFFIPGMNLDEAGVAMTDLNFAVEQMKLRFEDHDFSITITIGVEEYDYNSPLEDLLKSADEKLYMGKNSGRNKVIV